MAHCTTCTAKDQTITVLADQVDWLRAQLLQNPSVVRHSAVAAPPPVQESAAKFDGASWYTDDEEDVISALENGVLSTEAAERALAAIQAQNTTLEVVK